MQKKTVTFEDQDNEGEKVKQTWEKVACPGRRTVRRAGEFKINTRDKEVCPGSLM